MKKFVFLFAFLCMISMNAQKLTIAQLLQLKPQYVDEIDMKGLSSNYCMLRMDFNDSKILNQESAQRLKGLVITRVDLYYTAFQVAESFSQPALNKARFEELKKTLPYVFTLSTVEWRVIGQNGCKNEKEARRYFHGFVIHYMEEVTMKSMAKELNHIKSIVNNDSLGKDSLFVYNDTKIKRKRCKTGFYLPILKHKRAKGIVYSRKGIWNRKPQYHNTYDTVVVQKKGSKYIPSKDAMVFVKRNLSDSTIFSVLSRNKSWEDMLFICDVTGSMSPYTSQLLLWFKLNMHTSKAKYFTFFNDGDNTADNKKKVGRIGGIYQTEARTFYGVENTMSTAMTKGSGGDAPENNCEAILKAIETYPEAKELVMIADNWANIKDIALVAKIKRPVHVILCGSNNGFINTDYLELAYSTGGSIHTIEQDLNEMMKLSEGSIFKFGKQTFKIQKGKFVALNAT